MATCEIVKADPSLRYNLYGARMLSKKACMELNQIFQGSLQGKVGMVGGREGKNGQGVTVLKRVDVRGGWVDEGGGSEIYCFQKETHIFMSLILCNI